MKMKKIIQYMQDQASAQAQARYAGTSYLSAPGKEPQQRTRHRSPSYLKTQHQDHAQRMSSHPSSHSHSFPWHLSGGGSSIPNPIPRDVTKHQYAQDNILQSYEVYVPEIGESNTNGVSSTTPKPGASSDSTGPEYWVIYIHGGYFRDPLVTSASLHPALSQLVASSKHAEIRRKIAGYASINYRLSRHPDHPQDEERTGDYEMRQAVWPEHITDVLTAIGHLQGKYGFGERYLLVGHSVGATMALLAALSPKLEFGGGLSSTTTSTTTGDTTRGRNQIQLPMAVLGVCGIYDFPKLHQVFPSYVDITRNAIPDPADDTKASPDRYDVATYQEVWSRGRRKVVVLAHSKEDGLVDWAQVESMRDNLVGPGNWEIGVKMIEVQGRHNEVWEKGEELARVVAEAVRLMGGLEEG